MADLRIRDQNTHRIHPDEMPLPDALINYSGGDVGPAMFHYTPTDVSALALDEIAREHGFKMKGEHMPEYHPLMEKYMNGSSTVIQHWQPDVPDGWQLGGKCDTEDGPYAFFLQRIEAST
jgi:hypothetical protein